MIDLKKCNRFTDEPLKEEGAVRGGAGQQAQVDELAVMVTEAGAEVTFGTERTRSPATPHHAHHLKQNTHRK